MNRKLFKNIDWTILVCTILLLIIGLIALYSATIGSELEGFKKQITWILISIPIFLVAIYIDYKSLARFSVVLYVISIILLIAVLLTSAINGATSWFSIGPVSIQPGEIAKIAVILFLAVNIEKIGKKSKRDINKPLNLLKILGIVLLPIGLIVLQPDYGTAMSYVFALVCMLFVAGIDKKYIIVSFLILVITLPLLYFFVLPEHAKARIEVYLNPYSDPRGDGYNIIQSKIAIGAGRLLGLGFLNGTQTHLGFLYPKSTDFIFSVIGEEMGFIACSIIIVIYVILLTKAIKVAKRAKDDLGSYIAIGIVGMLLFHVLENIGMTMGLLPITGIPLPFISYGGSSMITNMIAIGLLLNISGRSKKTLFDS